MTRQKRKEATTGPVIPDATFQQITQLDTHSSVSLRNLVYPPDLNKQLAAVKEVSGWLRTQTDETLDRSCLPSVVIELLAHLYYKAGSKCPLRRLIASSLQGMPQEELVRKQLTSQAMTFICDTSQWSVPCCRLIVDNISSLLENFPIGEEVMICLHKDGIACLISILKQHLSVILSEQDTPADQSAIMQECLITLRVFNRLLQKSSAQITENMNKKHPDCLEVSNTIASAVIPVVNILQNDSTLLDCRVAAGMALPLIIKILMGSQAVLKVIDYFFPAVLCEKIPSPVLDIYISETTFSGVSECSHLCLLNGVLAMFDTAELLTEVYDMHIFLTDFLANHILGMIPRIEEPNTKLIMSRSLVLLSKKTSELLEQRGRAPQSQLSRNLGGESDMIQQLVQYSLNCWEDPIDIVRQQARTVFDNTIKCHLLATGEDAEASLFLRKLVKSLLGLEWNTKGKYGPLACLVKYVGACEIIRLTPEMPSKVLELIGEQSLTTYVSELYVRLSESSMSELRRSGQESSVSPWLQLYVSPVITVLCGHSRAQKQHTMEYIVPSLMKQCPQTLEYILGQLTGSDGDGGSGGNLGALITCLKLAKSLKLLKTNSLQHVAGSGNMWNGIISEDAIRQALCHPVDQTRLDALGLICEHQKTTEPLQEEDLVLVKFFLQYNMCSQEPAFRQQMAATFKKLFIRLRDGGRALLRNHTEAVKRGKEIHLFRETWKTSQDFMIWLLSHLFEALYPGAGFPGRTTALTLLSLLMEIMTKDGSPDELEYELLAQIHSHHVQTLVECLRDTFETNRVEACSILLRIPPSHVPKSDQETRDLFSTAVDLASSCRPQDGTTAAFLLRYLIHLPNIGEHIDHEYRRENLTVKATSDKGVDMEYNSLSALELLTQKLEEQLVVAKQSLLHAAATKPVYPMIQCVRYLLSDVNLRQVERTERWKCLIDDLIHLCLDVAVVVSPGVNNSSPEGNVPTDSIIGPGLALEGLVTDRGDLDLLQESATKVTLMPEYLIVCCWRCIKEVSLLLGQVTQSAPISHPDSNTQGGLLTIEQIHVIGQYFNTQLLESRHRGAFELAYAGFVKMTTMLWKSPIPDIYKLPKQWLEEILYDIKSRDPDSRLCSTRRSAGVPFYVQALVSTTTSESGKQCFQWVMRELLELASVPTEECDHEDTARVHCLNILRALYKDTRLADDVFPFIAKGVKVSILGYGSKFWAIRNSSTLMYSALVNRIFGVKKGKDDQAKRNCLSGRVFFNRFPSLYGFLLSTLEEATSNIGASGVYHLHPALYPTLMVLGRLYPSVIESADPNTNLSAFIPCVIRCASTPVHKTRMMAARAIRPLVSQDQYVSVLTTLISGMAEERQPISQNYVHGALVQLMYMLKDLGDMPVSCQCTIASILVPFLLRMSKVHLCFTVKSVLSQVSLTVNCHAWPPLGVLVEEALAKLKQTQHIDYSGLVSVPVCMWMPSVSEFFSNEAKSALVLAQCTNDEGKSLHSTVLTVLSSEIYEVRLQGLRYLQELLSNSESTGSTAECGAVRVVPGSIAECGAVRVVPGSTAECGAVRVVPGSAAECGAVEVVPGSTAECGAVEVVPGSIAECGAVRVVPVSSAESGAVRVVSGLQSSSVIFSSLVESVMYMEHHEECLELALHTLPFMKSTCALPWNCLETTYPLEKVWERVASLLEHRRDEVRCGAIEVLGCLVPFVCQQAKQGEEKSLLHLKDWCDILSSRSSVEQSFDMRLACSIALAKNASLLGPETRHILGDGAHSLWTISLKLLQDEDEEVRQQMAHAIEVLQHEYPNMLTAYTCKGNILPELALEIMVKTFLNLHNSIDQLSCAKSVMRWIEEDLEPGLNHENCEVRLFDRGEMNTYKDDLRFIDMIASLAIKVLSCSKSEQFADLLTVKLTDVIQWLQKGREKWKNMTSKSPFVTDSNQDSYDESIVDICRKLVSMTMLCYLSPLSEDNRMKLHSMCEQFQQVDFNGSMNTLLFRKCADINFICANV